MKTLKWLWQISGKVCKEGGAKKTISCEIRQFRQRVNFISKALLLSESLQLLMYPCAGSPLQRTMEQRPEVLAGVIIWPYICSSWNTKMRLQRIDEHFRVIGLKGGMLDFPCDKALDLLDLTDIVTNLKVVLDQPKWFMREGLLVINLFVLDIRIDSLAFSFAFEDDKIVAYIGAIQGINAEDILDDYKNLTKAMHGMRPRDLLVELFRIFCRCVGVSKIYAVSDAKRQHRSSYFGAEKSKDLFLDYDDIWSERGGVRSSEDFFALAIDTPMKNLDEVPSKKRAMYRRRYELLLAIQNRINIACTKRFMA